MSLWEMSAAGSVLIMAVCMVRAVFINRLPKRTFLILWGIVTIRLLTPFSVPSAYSVYSLIPQQLGSGGSFDMAGYLLGQAKRQEAGAAGRAEEAGMERAVWEGAETASGGGRDNGMEGTDRRQEGFPAGKMIWLAGCILCLVFFGSLYIKFRRQFAVSIPVKNDFAERWVQEHKIRRPIEIRQSDMIKAPLTYGLRRPVILMPKHMDWENEKLLEYVLMHEYIHIRRFDAAAKLTLLLALSVHWFNPFVWMMYILCNRDMELACDEMVVRAFGESHKSEYAHILVDMEEMKNGFMPLCNHLLNHAAKNAIEKRIIAIMKIKKTSILAVICAAVLVAGAGAGFAASAVTPEKGFEEILQDNVKEVTGQVGGIISEAEKVRYSLENWELVIDSIDETRADCTFYADWISTRRPEDDPMILGMYQAAEALDDRREKAYAEEIAQDWLVEMQSWEEAERLDTRIVILPDEKGKWLLYYPYVMDGVETLMPLEEYARDHWTEDEEERRQMGIDIIDGAIGMMRNP